MQNNNFITNWLVDAGVIEKEEMELYDYAIISMILLIAPIVLAVLIGLILRCPMEAIIMVVPFMTLRKFCGGLHLKKLYVCLIVSTMIFFLSLLFVIYTTLLHLWYCIYVFDGVAILIMCPLDNVNKEILTKEQQLYKKISLVQWIIYLCVIIGLTFWKKFNFVKSVISGITIASCMLLIGHLVKYIKDRRI